MYMRNKEYPFFSILFLVAAAWNLLGAGFGYFNTSFTFQEVFNKELNDPVFYEIYKGAWGTTLIFFFGYLIVAYNPLKHTGLALIGGVGKFFFAIAEFNLYLTGLADSIILIIVIGDLIFCIFFVDYFLKLFHLKKQII